MRDYVAAARPLMLCFDNYNKKFASGKLSTKKDHVYDLTNCTVVGATRCENPVDDSFIYDNGIFDDVILTLVGLVVPSIPYTRAELKKFIGPLMVDIRKSSHRLWYDFVFLFY